MSPKALIEHAIDQTLKSFEDPSGPELLKNAIRHAVFPGGARIRPQLTLAVAAANGNDDPKLALGAAVAIELLHCGSLVHDDLPCFDNADLRRGLPTIHAAYGERIAVLTGDALIVMAFQGLVSAANQSLNRLAPVLNTIMSGVGAPHGIIAGQAWECESKVSLRVYQQAKTGALFTAATTAGAISAGADPKPWQFLGDSLGEAYQVADDIRDVIGDMQSMGKPVGKDEELDRPSATRELGLSGAVEYFDGLVAKAVDSVPECSGAPMLRKLVAQESERLVPNALYQRTSAPSRSLTKKKVTH
jgi:geranylgeranyl diphosphate synthase type II